MIGRTLGHYQITEELGEGGMGVVYKAQDLHLDRPVALKVLPPEKMADSDRKQRFAQEARAASALNHPSIVHIYDIASEGGIDFIAMEYVAGKTLDQVIHRKGMRVNEALKIAVQVADALAAAHAIGIVHRDIKPSNVMVNDQGRVKVLDFGLAKLTGRDESLASQMTTGAAVQTDAGRIVGTVSYMSPEQAQGRSVDARSDIFSFGTLLYEMVSGQRPFQGESSVATLAAILDKDPPSLVGEIPAELDKVVARCLRKDAGRRYQHMDDIRMELQDLVEESDSGKLGAAVAAPARRRLPWILAATALAVAALAAAAWFLFLRGDRALPLPRLGRLTSSPGNETNPALSPDGRQLAFSWNGEKEDSYDIYIQRVGETAARRVTTDPGSDTYPCWSPGGTRLAFRRLSEDRRTGIIFRISSEAGEERKVGEVPDVGAGLSWSPDEKWLAVSRSRPAGGSADNAAGIYLLPVEGGEPRRVTTPQAPAIDAYPQYSWDGRLLAFARHRWPGAVSDLFIQALSSDGLCQGEPQQVTHSGMLIQGLAWHPNGRAIVFSAMPAPMLYCLYRVSVSGNAPPERIELAGFHAFQPTTSRDGNRLALMQSDVNYDIWRVHPDAAPERLIAGSLDEYAPQYSPDGLKIAFTSNRTETGTEIFVAHADGTSPIRLTYGPGRNQGTARWSRDGKWITFNSQDATGQYDIYVIEASGGKERRLTSGPFDENHPSWSQDGKWVYYKSNRSGRDEIWRARFAGGEEHQVTTEGGVVPFESTDGHTLIYTKQTGGGLFAKPLVGGPEQRLTGGVGSVWFAVVGDGIYYLSPRGADGQYRVLCYEQTSRTTREVARFTAAALQQGLTVSRDQKSVLVPAAIASTGRDLWLIEPFR